MANNELMHKVLQYIKEHPDEYDPSRWHKDFAGWALRLAMPGMEVCKDSCDIETLFDADGERVWITDIGPWATRLLGLTPDQAVKLFCGGNTVADLEYYVAAFTAEVTARRPRPTVTDRSSVTTVTASSGTTTVGRAPSGEWSGSLSPRRASPASCTS